MNVPFVVLCLVAPTLIMVATSPVSDVIAFPSFPSISSNSDPNGIETAQVILEYDGQIVVLSFIAKDLRERRKSQIQVAVQYEWSRDNYDNCNKLRPN